MKASVILLHLLLAFILFVVGCEPPLVGDEPSIDGSEKPVLELYNQYAPTKLDILPLTEFVIGANGSGLSRLDTYVSLLDAFGCQKKSPGRFRFELYEYIPRSADPRGKRLIMWPEVDLTTAPANNDYWRDHLRAYHFSLDFEPESGRIYILEVTCLCPSGRRLSAELDIPVP